ncbi:hypothetical protein FEM48_Zijuj09G0084500 [Ziziphus jujuba var. spinosa]|nr:hypothetical protein FEM48_Zijuj09G0084500 [Ziziphus jujuba var. spinosa]
MASISLSFSILGISLWLSVLISPAYSLDCTSQKFTNKKIYANCSDLPVLSSYLHWTYNATNSSLSVAFVAHPPNPDSWVGWGINPTGTGMPGAQALVAVKQSEGSFVVKTYNLSSYKSIMPANLSFDVWDKSAEYANGTVTIFASVKVPKDAEKLNYIWQVGPGVNKTNGFLIVHDFKPANLASKATLSLVANTSTTDGNNSTSSGNNTTNGNSGSGGISRFGDAKTFGLYLGLLFVLVNLLTF